MMWLKQLQMALKLNRWPVITLKEQLKEEQKQRIERIWPKNNKNFWSLYYVSAWTQTPHGPGGFSYKRGGGCVQTGWTGHFFACLPSHSKGSQTLRTCAKGSYAGKTHAKHIHINHTQSVRHKLCLLRLIRNTYRTEPWHWPLSGAKMWSSNRTTPTHPGLLFHYVPSLQLLRHTRGLQTRDRLRWRSHSCSPFTSSQGLPRPSLRVHHPPQVFRHQPWPCWLSLCILCIMMIKVVRRWWLNTPPGMSALIMGTSFCLVLVTGMYTFTNRPLKSSCSHASDTAKITCTLF